MRRRLPSGQRAAGVGVDAGFLDAHEHLPAAVRLLHRPGGRERGVGFRQVGGEVVGQRRPSGRAGNEGSIPPEDVGEERPGVGQCRAFVCVAEMFGDRIAIGAQLLLRHQPVTGEDGGRDDEAGRLDVAEPFEIGVGRGHAQLLPGQR